MLVEAPSLGSREGDQDQQRPDDLDELLDQGSFPSAIARQNRMYSRS